MIADAAFFRDLAYVVVAAVLGGALAWKARQPLILGYVLGGILIGPLTPGPSVSDMHTFELFAEIGVVLLMFAIGIEFSVRELLRVKWLAILGGPLGILLSVGMGLGAGKLLGWPPIQGAVIGMVVSVASTMVLARFLMDRGELNSRHGRIMIGITLVEDLAVVVLIVLIPRLGSLDAARVLSVGKGVGVALLVLGPLYYLASRVVAPLLTRVARMHSEEVFLLATLAIGVGTAALTQALGLSLALGAFLAGLLISGSDYAQETLARMLPLRDLFVAFFFVTVGALIHPQAVLAHLPLLGVIVGLVVVGKFAIWVAVVLLFRQPLYTALLAGVGLTQIGEFSYILVRVAKDAGHIGEDVYHATLAASLLTILVNATLVRIAPRWIGKVRGGWAGKALAVTAAAGARERHVVLCGYGRVGSEVAQSLEAFGAPYVVLETDPDVVLGLRQRGVPCIFGNGSGRQLLEAAGVERAALVVITIPAPEHAYLAVRTARALNPAAPILARAHDYGTAERLARGGATEVIQPEVEAASTLIRHSLRRLSLPRERVLAYLDRFRDAMDDGFQEPAAPDAALPEVHEIVLAGSEVVGRTLQESRIRERFGVTVVAVTHADGRFILHPPAATTLHDGDRLRVFGLPAQIQAFRSDAACE